MDLEKERAFLAQRHPSNLEHDSHSINHELATSPLFTASALQTAGAAIFPLRGLLGATTDNDLIYFNTNSPSSGVVCGVQGSGKSHTVSCLLENALVKDPRTGNLSQPLAALVFHFDEQDGDRPCEAAYLGSPATANDAHVKRITVLTSSVNIANRRRTYAHLPNVDVQPLLLGDADITAPRLLALMGMSDDAEKTMPLYMKTILQIVRDIGPDGFSYTEFKLRTKRERFDSTQRIMLAHRLRLLDAFVQSSSRPIRSYFAPGDMVLVDLTDPFLNGEFASLLFDIVLGSFMGWNSPTGRIVVLDEAHKYLTNSKSSRLNRSIATIIRQQRHLATRVIIATQEPTVIPDTVLDLSSFVVCHRFTSPSWCSHLSRHVSTENQSWFRDVMNLPTGDAIVFSPAARTTETLAPLGTEALHIKIRPRLTSDGGASVMAIDSVTRLPLKEVNAAPTASYMSASPVHTEVDDACHLQAASTQDTTFDTHLAETKAADSALGTAKGLAGESGSSDRATTNHSTPPATYVAAPSVTTSSDRLPLAPLEKYRAEVDLHSSVISSLSHRIGEMITTSVFTLIAKLHRHAVVNGDRVYLPLDSIHVDLPGHSSTGSGYDELVFKHAVKAAEKMGLVSCFADAQGRDIVRLMPPGGPKALSTLLVASSSMASVQTLSTPPPPLFVARAKDLGPQPTASAVTLADPTPASTSRQTSRYPPLEAYLSAIQPSGKYKSEHLPKIHGVVRFLYEQWVSTGRRKAFVLVSEIGPSLSHIEGKLTSSTDTAQAMGLVLLAGGKKKKNRTIQLVAVPPSKPSDSPAVVIGSGFEPSSAAALASSIPISELGETGSLARPPAPTAAGHYDIPSPRQASPHDTSLDENSAESMEAGSFGGSSNAVATGINSSDKATPVHTLPSSADPAGFSIPPIPSPGAAYASNLPTGISRLVESGPVDRLAPLEDYLEQIELLPSLLLPLPPQIRATVKGFVIRLITELHKQALRELNRNFIPFDRIVTELSCGSEPVEMAIDVAQKAGLVTRLSDGHKHSFVRLMSPNGRTVSSPISSPAITSTVTESTSTEAAIPPIDVYLSRLTSGGLAEPQLSESRALVQFLHKRWIETGKRQVFPYKSHRLRHLVSLFPGGSLRKMCPTVVALGIVTIAAPGAARWVQLNHIYHI